MNFCSIYYIKLLKFNNNIYFFSAIIFLLIIFPNKITPQQIGVLRGNVLDSLTMEPLAFTNIVLENTSIGTSTNANGYFLITNIPAEHGIFCQSILYWIYY